MKQVYNFVTTHVWFWFRIVIAVSIIGGCYLFYRQLRYVHCLEQQAAAGYVDFDASMQRAGYPKRFEHPLEAGWYTILQKLYERNNLKMVTCDTGVTIPKIIHQIWLGSPFPEKYRAFQESWKRYHPEWEYRLWTDADIAKLPLRNRALYDAAKNYGEKSDIARYEILHTYGGLYVDTDFECLKNFDVLNHCYDFYIGIQPLDTNLVQLGIGLIGCVPGHRMMQLCIDSLAENALHCQQIIQRTGPIYCTRIFTASCGAQRDRTVALPATYFYPKGYTQADVPASVWQRPESFAVHHWEGSWLKKEAWVAHR